MRQAKGCSCADKKGNQQQWQPHRNECPFHKAPVRPPVTEQIEAQQEAQSNLLKTIEQFVIMDPKYKEERADADPWPLPNPPVDHGHVTPRRVNHGHMVPQVP